MEYYLLLFRGLRLINTYELRDKRWRHSLSTVRILDHLRLLMLRAESLHQRRRYNTPLGMLYTRQGIGELQSSVTDIHSSE